MGEQPKELELFEQSMNALNARIKALDDGGVQEKKNMDAELVRMYGQLALFKDKTEKLGLDNAQLQQKVSETESLIKNADKTTELVNDDLSKVSPPDDTAADLNRLVPLMVSTQRKALQCKNCNTIRHRGVYRGFASRLSLSPLAAAFLVAACILG